MLTLFISQIRILKNLRINLEDSDGPITPKERFALIFLY